MLYCGIDMHKKSCEGKVEDDNETCMREGRFDNNTLGFKKFFRSMNTLDKNCRVIFIPLQLFILYPKVIIKK